MLSSEPSPYGVMKLFSAQVPHSRISTSDELSSSGNGSDPGAKYEGEKFPPLCEQTLVDARLHDIVDAIDLSETQQHLIDEEDTDVAEETSEEVEADMSRKDPPDQIGSDEDSASVDFLYNHPGDLVIKKHVWLHWVHVCVAMVKTDGGMNIVANTFVNNIPGWNDEEQFPIEDSVLHPPMASTRTSSVNQQEVEPMVEIEVSTTDDDNENEEDPLLQLFKEMGVSNEMMEALVQDVEENGEFQDVEVEMEEMMPSTDSIPCVILPLTASSTGQETDYILYSKLRSDCVAHKLQLVIKDGFKALVGEAALVISHVRKLVNYVRKSVLNTEMVFTAVGFRLSVKNAASWNSTYFMFMLMKFLQAIDKDPTLCSRLNAVDFETIGNVIPAYIGLRNNLTLTIKNRKEVVNPASQLASIVKKTKDFVQALRESLELRFSPVLCDVNYVLETIFDSRFKKGWIKFSGYYEASVMEAVIVEVQMRYRVLRECMDDQAVHNLVQPVPSANDAADVANERASRPSITRKRRASQSLYSSVIETPRPGSFGPIKVIDELDAYLNEPGVPMEVTVDPVDPDSELRPTNPLEF
ncbi:hypothetical protein OUZ56_017155 [Daphnia magna]|uniref:Uncharacterized protein n=1 Tax=Daphnia magna TaxID=35525 RepID=A0ABR0AS95_9CRUS|nr:hypothetical protein OUZ56_017155 [Daphnia magna]